MAIRIHQYSRLPGTRCTIQVTKSKTDVLCSLKIEYQLSNQSNSQLAYSVKTYKKARNREQFAMVTKVRYLGRMSDRYFMDSSSRPFKTDAFQVCMILQEY